jgi:crossover junction endodeoxyribonuclease RuvC
MYIGIDPGTHRAAIAVLRNDGTLFGCAALSIAGSTIENRLADLYNEVENFLMRLSPFNGEGLLCDESPVGIECPWVGKNAQTALTIGMAWGICAAAVCSLGYRFIKVQPKEGKMALTGDGGADKETMRKMAKLQFGIDDATRDADIVHAIGIALAVRKHEIERLMEESRER